MRQCKKVDKNTKFDKRYKKQPVTTAVNDNKKICMKIVKTQLALMPIFSIGISVVSWFDVKRYCTVPWKIS